MEELLSRYYTLQAIAPGGAVANGMEKAFADLTRLSKGELTEEEAFGALSSFASNMIEIAKASGDVASKYGNFTKTINDAPATGTK